MQTKGNHSPNLDPSCFNLGLFFVRTSKYIDTYCTCLRYNIPNNKCTSTVGHLMAMTMRRHNDKRITQLSTGLPWKSLDVTIGQVLALYCPGGCHSHQFWHKQSSCGIVKLLSEASVQKTQNRPSSQLIKATSCVERLNATIKTKELCILLAIKC